jgi:23S rRNA pseudouridine1911/1915/1917 synthase
LSGGRRCVVAGREDDGERLDAWLASVTGISRTRIQRLVADGLVTVDGVPAKKNHTMARGESVEWELPEPEPEEILPESIPLDVVYEDEHILVIDKPAELVMYPGPGHTSGTLLNALIGRYPEIEGVGGRGRPGVFHRLDRGTSGLVAVARSERAYNEMVRQMQEREVTRQYTALVTGSIAAQTGTINAPMGRSRTNRKRMAVDRYAGRKAVSRFEVLERFGDDFTLVEVSLETGRTHQIRVHFSHIGHPVACDPEYSRGKACKRLDLSRQFLHAHRLSFEHPVKRERMSFESELPEDLEGALGRLRSQR